MDNFEMFVFLYWSMWLKLEMEQIASMFLVPIRELVMELILAPFDNWCHLISAT